MQTLDLFHHTDVLLNLIEIFPVEESLVIPMTNVDADEQVAALARSPDQRIDIMLEDFERLKVSP